MLDRNRRIKPSPERFQAVQEEFDVVFTVEERIYDCVIEGTYMDIVTFIGLSYTYFRHKVCIKANEGKGYNYRNYCTDWCKEFGTNSGALSGL